MKVRELLSDEGKWTKREYARDRWGCAVRVENEEAVCFCLLGALWKCYAGSAVRLSLEEGIRAKLGNSITSWNDAPERKFEEVKALVEELDI